MPVKHSVSMSVKHSVSMPVKHSVSMPVKHSVSMPVKHSIRTARGNYICRHTMRSRQTKGRKECWFKQDATQHAQLFRKKKLFQATEHHSRHHSTSKWNRISKQLALIIVDLSCLFFEKGVLPWKSAHVLCCPIKIRVLFNLLCVWIVFQNAIHQLCFWFFFDTQYN